MDTQRNDIGDRAAPAEMTESVQELDPSVPCGDGEVEQPGASGGHLLAVSQFSAGRTATIRAKTRIEELQEHTRDLVEALVTGKLEGGLLISGCGGVGKSRAVRDALGGLIAAGQPINVTYLDHVGPLRLYEELEKHKTSGEVLVFEEIEASLKNEDVLGILKSATEGPTHPVTKRKIRTVRWASSVQVKQGLPPSLVFEGSIILILNDIPTGNQSLAAFETRLFPIPFNVTPADVDAFMRHLVHPRGKTIPYYPNPVTLNESQCLEVIDYLKVTKRSDLRQLDQALAAYVSFPNAWKAKVDLLKQSNLRLTRGQIRQIALELNARRDLTPAQKVDAVKDRTGRSQAAYYRDIAA